MIIKHIPGAENPETDTDKLADVDAMILEKCEELRALCLNARRQCVIMADARGKEDGNGTYFWNMSMKSAEWSDIGETKIEIDTDEKRKAFNNMLQLIHNFVGHFTGRTYGIVDMRIVLAFQQYQDALAKIAHYDDQSIWKDDRDDASDNMLSIARNALGEKE